VVDYQPNVAGGIPPLYGRNSLPWTLPALVIPTLTYWALLPRMPGRRRRRLALLHSSTQRQTGP
jgi:hypothetical protein